MARFNRYVRGVCPSRRDRDGASAVDLKGNRFGLGSEDPNLGQVAPQENTGKPLQIELQLLLYLVRKVVQQARDAAHLPKASREGVFTFFVGVSESTPVVLRGHPEWLSGTPTLNRDEDTP